jgi:hypothetical protein
MQGVNSHAVYQPSDHSDLLTCANNTRHLASPRMRSRAWNCHTASSRSTSLEWSGTTSATYSANACRAPCGPWDAVAIRQSAEHCCNVLQHTIPADSVLQDKRQTVHRPGVPRPTPAAPARSRAHLVRRYGSYSSRSRGTWIGKPWLVRLAPEGWLLQHSQQPPPFVQAVLQEQRRAA